MKDTQTTFVRKCANTKNRKTFDVQCALNATHGDFCSRHWKHPQRFIKVVESPEKRYTRNEHKAASRIQRVWKRKSPFIFIQSQGLGVYDRSMSQNETEIYTLDSIMKIPKLYYFSFTDTNKKVWSFDIRSLGQILSLGILKQNPYNREPLSSAIMTKIRNRLTWLRKRKYSILYPIGTELTPEQVWAQKILDIFMKIESFGYYVSCEWFTGMSIADHKLFYKTLYELWYYRLGLTAQDRDKIVPDHWQKGKILFVYTPESFLTGRAHTKLWWERLNLGILETFLTRSPDKEQQKLGAMYSVMGLVAVNSAAADVFPWAGFF